MLETVQQLQQQGEEEDGELGGQANTKQRCCFQRLQRLVVKPKKADLNSNEKVSWTPGGRCVNWTVVPAVREGSGAAAACSLQTNISRVHGTGDKVQVVAVCRFYQFQFTNVDSL